MRVPVMLSRHGLASLGPKESHEPLDRRLAPRRKGLLFNRRWSPVRDDFTLAIERGIVTGNRWQGTRHLEYSDRTGRYHHVERRGEW